MAALKFLNYSFNVIYLREDWKPAQNLDIYFYIFIDTYDVTRRSLFISLHKYRDKSNQI